MVRGLDLFRQRFRDHEGTFVVIGGAACDQWFTRHGLAFRATKDLDIVLITTRSSGRIASRWRASLSPRRQR